MFHIVIANTHLFLKFEVYNFTNERSKRGRDRISHPLQQHVFREG